MDETGASYGVNKNGVPYKVLIVDDSIFVQKQLRQILLAEGFEVIETATDGAEGVEKYRQLKDKIDVVTMDITMPNMDGITALTKIIEINPNVKVVMISALGREDLVKKALMAGAKNYIVKPLDRKKVLERLASIF
ncbi:MAG: response regulator [Spirochaetaceae bacterium]|nr:response regulator [Spirochaetaceae bacterium]